MPNSSYASRLTLAMTSGCRPVATPKTMPASSQIRAALSSGVVIGAATKFAVMPATADAAGPGTPAPVTRPDNGSATRPRSHPAEPSSRPATSVTGTARSVCHSETRTVPWTRCAA